jgi:hypothetical protein
MYNPKIDQTEHDPEIKHSPEPKMKTDDDDDGNKIKIGLQKSVDNRN